MSKYKLEDIKVGQEILIRATVESDMYGDLDDKFPVSVKFANTNSRQWISPDCIEQIVGRPFDWKDVEGYMGFEDIHGNKVYCLGRNLSGEFLFWSPDWLDSTYSVLDADTLTRAPEHDIKVR